jgi:hypothetical protein
VTVYIVSRKPIGSTYHQNIPWPKPELLIVSVKTKFALWWWSGTKMRTAMITATPRTCHHTEIPLNSATRCEEKMFRTACNARMTTNTAKTSESVTESEKSMTPRFRPHRLNSEHAKFAHA